VFPKELRVKRKKTIDLLSQSRYSVKTNIVTLKAVTQDSFAIMIVVSKKVFKKAHDRVLAKRRVLAIVRLSKLDEQLPKAAYQIRLHNSKIASYTFGELQNDLLDGFTKLSQIVVLAK
jgi:ribonuclease P protein component